MGRLATLDPAQMDDAQKALHDRIAARRGGVRGPFNAWLHSPKLCDRVESLGAYLRFETDIPMALKEIAVLLVARAFTSQYMWRAHVRFALRHGLTQEQIDAIRERREPPLRSDAERIVYDFASELLRDHQVSDRSWNALVGLFDARRAVEFTALIGNFCMVALALNAFRVDLPDGDEALLPA